MKAVRLFRLWLARVGVRGVIVAWLACALVLQAAISVSYSLWTLESGVRRQAQELLAQRLSALSVVAERSLREDPALMAEVLTLAAGEFGVQYVALLDPHSIIIQSSVLPHRGVRAGDAEITKGWSVADLLRADGQMYVERGFAFKQLRFVWPAAPDELRSGEFGSVVMVLDLEVLRDERIHEMWRQLLFLLPASAAVLVLTYLLLDRWLYRPMRALRSLTARIGAGRSVGDTRPFLLPELEDVRCALVQLTRELEQQMNVLLEASWRLKESERRFQEGIDAMDIGFMIRDPDGSTVYMNELFQQASTGFSEEDRHQAEGIVSRQGRWFQELRRRTQSGYEVTLRVDITDLVEARLKAEAASEAKSRFLAMISHELRTPMNAILGVGQLLNDPQLDAEERRAHVRMLQEAGQGLLALLNDILDFSKVEAGKLELQPAPCRPAEELQTVRRLFEEQAHAKGLSLLIEWQGPSSARFVLDRLRLRQMLSNLVSNAIKFTDRGQIRIVGRVEEEQAGQARLHFGVKDTGIGIPADAVDRLFQPFSQLDTGLGRHFGGTGLGLSIVRRLAELMGGKAGVESTEGKGSYFWFEIQAAVVPDSSAELERSVTPVETGAIPDLSSLRVLVVEDHPPNRVLIGHLLKKLALQQVEMVEDGAQAVELVCGGSTFDVVLMDVQMPRMNGLEATRAIRECELRNRQRRVTIIGLSANAYEEDVQSGLAAGMDDFVVKPVQLERLRQALARVVANVASVAPSDPCPEPGV